MTFPLKQPNFIFLWSKPIFLPEGAAQSALLLTATLPRERDDASHFLG